VYVKSNGFSHPSTEKLAILNAAYAYVFELSLSPLVLIAMDEDPSAQLPRDSPSRITVDI
jgi:hypothetical protein